MKHIRNFVITAHIDHGKSTLADRLLEVTGTVEARKMRAQYLDQLELERERGITIKMAPVRMRYQDYMLNLIDTPGHSDFAYEVSRALEAVEGAVLLVDATKGVQAQTLSNLRAAKDAGLTLIGAVNKIDMESAKVEETVQTLAALLEVPPSDVFRVSAKTGEGVQELLEGIVERVPPPVSENDSRALVFDSLYNDHKGALAFVRIFGGTFRKGDSVRFIQGNMQSKIKELGYFSPEFKPCETLSEGEMGYVATGMKQAESVRIGDTVTEAGAQVQPLPGYREPKPVVFVSFYPDAGTTFDDLKKALERLRLTDAALAVKPDANEALGRGFRVGFLGQLHVEITAHRLSHEFGLQFVTSFPSIAYRIRDKGENYVIREPHAFPEHPEKAWEPMIRIEIVTSPRYLQDVLSLQQTFAFEVEETETMGDGVLIRGVMPLRELVRDFDDRLKSVSQGFASFSYVLGGEREADVVKLEILVAGEEVPALTRIVPRRDVEREARNAVTRLKELLPRAQFAQAIQARAGGRIIARETLRALKKDVTGHLYGGDRTRKMKLWKKQKKGKEKLLGRARTNVPVEVFRELLKK